MHRSSVIRALLDEEVPAPCLQCSFALTLHPTQRCAVAYGQDPPAAGAAPECVHSCPCPCSCGACHSPWSFRSTKPPLPPPSLAPPAPLANTTTAAGGTAGPWSRASRVLCAQEKERVWRDLSFDRERDDNKVYIWHHDVELKNYVKKSLKNQTTRIFKIRIITRLINHRRQNNPALALCHTISEGAELDAGTICDILHENAAVELAILDVIQLLLENLQTRRRAHGILKAFSLRQPLILDGKDAAAENALICEENATEASFERLAASLMEDDAGSKLVSAGSLDEFHAHGVAAPAATSGVGVGVGVGACSAAATGSAARAPPPRAATVAMLSGAHPGPALGRVPARRASANTPGVSPPGGGVLGSSTNIPAGGGGCSGAIQQNNTAAVGADPAAGSDSVATGDGLSSDAKR
ncbi:hypothetical protein HDU83_005572 [Entophlyctis luteolus]|nr:hypothetical protein HDU83_005572 [Entophlyctis luteolus]